MANKKNDALKITAVDVYLEKRASRKYVGQLSRENDKFIFEYNDSYLFDDRSIAIGPDLPLNKKNLFQVIYFSHLKTEFHQKRTLPIKNTAKWLESNHPKMIPLL